LFGLAYNIWYQRLKYVSENRAKFPNNNEIDAIKQELVSLAKRQQEVQFLHAVDEELDIELAVKNELAQEDLEVLTSVEIEGSARRKQWKRKKNKNNQR